MNQILSEILKSNNLNPVEVTDNNNGVGNEVETNLDSIFCQPFFISC